MKEGINRCASDTLQSRREDQNLQPVVNRKTENDGPVSRPLDEI